MGDKTTGSSQTNSIKHAVGKLISLDAELEVSAEAQLGADQVAAAKALLHDWIDTVVAVVPSPGLGRVSLIHANGKQSGISSSELPFLLTRPAGKARS